MKYSTHVADVTVFLTFLLLLIENAAARGVIVYNFGGIGIDVVKDLPDTETFQSDIQYHFPLKSEVAA